MGWDPILILLFKIPLNKFQPRQYRNNNFTESSLLPFKLKLYSKKEEAKLPIQKGSIAWFER